MHKCKLKLSFQRVFALLLIPSLLLLTACRRRSVSASEMMSAFLSEYGIEAVIYTPSIPEGEEGYFSPDMFYTMYSRDTSAVSDFALIMLSRSVSLGECAVFVCYNTYDAIVMSEACQRRLLLFSSASGINVECYTEDAFVKRHGNIVVMCALRDNTAAQRIWSGILDFY
ncbi:MAG: hypothetical protein IKD45_02045 [Clostridia bacterium]|nr:hypothetical protein [Clostridia bacterium]